MSLVLHDPTNDTSASRRKVPEVAQPFLLELDHFFREIMGEFEPELREPVAYALGHSGKRLRPTVLYLTGADADGSYNAHMVRAAAVVELVHLATLVHDDILDQADLRHNHPTVSKKYGTSSAVLLGDALFAQALQLASRFPTTTVCRWVSEATRKVCAGEIEQTLVDPSLVFDLERYYRIIERKTAVLFQVSCKLGALLGAPGSDQAELAGEFGRRLGLSYQIYDDLVDLVGSERAIGKTLGTDFRSGKSTLPLLLLYDRLDPERKKRLYSDFGQAGKNTGDDLLQWMHEYGVVEAVTNHFQREIQAARRAVRAMNEGNGSPILQSILDMVVEKFASAENGTVT